MQQNSNAMHESLFVNGPTVRKSNTTSQLTAEHLKPFINDKIHNQILLKISKLIALFLQGFYRKQRD